MRSFQDHSVRSAAESPCPRFGYFAGSQGAGTGANLMGLGGFPGMGSLAGLGAEGLASPSSQSRDDAEAQGRQVGLQSSSVCVPHCPNIEESGTRLHLLGISVGIDGQRGA